ncbi:leucyl aminopeptidase family protein [Gluconacetobacter entanii]|uniref:leucyl aminopeptidase family protein n=1 Tax=Gluconacetobacter entanii TaxID=108528 RepID=UPI001C9358CA|nr:leucyl aminopeptidase family protein [Gluconacetobacter entanii]MBY4639384.1 leucyl aminopeptidase family protein [Gluconacetobacter entanii]MCW4582158.1 leucyl aminopeptidase family protein [Gluconacetobacter entanii]MCW4585483.1 leucyl aminopeptidase family protein [Gluconacetobacter entanii]MCW4588556.1 leucyl aminopeptidase family protein [Gluconacetobacter entanii]
MTFEDFPCLLPEAAAGDLPVRVVHALRPAQLPQLADLIGGAAAAFATDAGFGATHGQVLLLPGEKGVDAALLGLGDGPQDEACDPFVYGVLPAHLPAGAWRVQAPAGVTADDIVLGFCLGGYRMPAFGRTQPDTGAQARLVVTPQAIGAAQVAACMCQARDLINTPPNLMGPDDLARAARTTLEPLGAQVRVVTGEALQAAYPTVAHVGMGSDRPPCVVVAEWRGSAADATAPLLSLAGKGVCFDTGGYDIKPASSMLRMKKDMGGAALMLALARLIMLRDLPLRLELRLGCVENSVSGHAMRPSDVIVTRSGQTVEVGNTDAEGRLVLCDLLSEACDSAPDLLLDAATLTGAARVALGPDLPALFSNDDAVAVDLLAAGDMCADPMWRLPLWNGYRTWLRSPVADMNNISSRPMAGAVTAALFLQNFVKTGVRWAHIDTYGWNDSARPGRPEGGESLCLRATYGGILKIFNIEDIMGQ